ncbi:MAG: hypothetical protein ACM3NQ_17395 [Bacteroidales bacterium]
MDDRATDLQVRLDALERQLRWQRRVGGAAALVLAVVLFAAFQVRETKGKFTELAVERLDVIEPDGQLVMSIANKARLPEPLIEGKTIRSGRKGPGIIFFDGKGWEVGGLTYGNEQKDGKFEAGGHFSFDQFKNDQVVFLSYQDDGTHKRSGLYIVDRSRTPTIDQFLAMRDEMAKASPEARKAMEEKLKGAAAQRIFVGSDDETAMVRMRDRAGRDRIRMTVAPDGAAKIEFLDENGKVVQTLPR